LANFEIWKKHRPPEKPDEVYDSYAFRVVEPESYAGKSIELYLPQRIAGLERAIQDEERVCVVLDKLELERLMRGSKTNLGHRPSQLVQDGVTRALRDLVKIRQASGSGNLSP